jgi:hypothetical protein
VKEKLLNKFGCYSTCKICTGSTVHVLPWSPCSVVDISLVFITLPIPRPPSPGLHFYTLCECDSFFFFFFSSGERCKFASQLHGVDQESSFMLFAKWRNLRRLKLECVERIGSGKFFIQVNFLYIHVCVCVQLFAQVSWNITPAESEGWVYVAIFCLSLKQTKLYKHLIYMYITCTLHDFLQLHFLVLSWAVSSICSQI